MSLPKIVILGLDGVSWSMIERLTGLGVMPRLAGLIAESAAGPMSSTRPEISPVAWTTFYTGRPPGHHGIYGFTEFEPGTWQVGFNSSAQVRVPYLWDWLDLKGGRSIVLNVPLTYPARPLSGIMVSGFVALDYQRAAHPPWVADFLSQSGYKLEADFEKVHQDREAFLSDLDQALAGRFTLFERFQSEPWDLFTLVVTDTDRLFHFFLREFLENGPIKSYFLGFFQRVDELVGRVIDWCVREAQNDRTPRHLIMLSDHGFAPVIEEFHLNRWLNSQGLLPSLGPEARALALDPTRIYLNHPPRFPAGRVTAHETENLALSIAAALEKEPAVDGVEWGRDLYSGPQAHLGPDMVVRPARGYEFKAKFNDGPVYTPSPLMGTHTFDDAFYLVRTWNGEQPAPAFEDVHGLGQYVFSLAGI